MTVKQSFSLEELIRNARCARGAFNPDYCMRHMCSNYPYDEQVCGVVLEILGYRPRVSLGDGRARGNPILPAR
jgi:hypothetical protein